MSKLNCQNIISRTVKYFVCLVFIVQAQGLQANNRLKSIFDVMHFQEVLSLTLEADFSTIDARRKEPIEMPARLSFDDENGLAQAWKVKVKTRGHFRLMNCEMPPLKIDFSKKDLIAAGLASFDDLKLVTHCVADKAEARALLQKEYLAYKLYNELTPYSFRVQMLKITYIDVSTGNKSKQWAFLIEDTAQLKDRSGMASLDNSLNLPRDTFHDGLLKIASVYQYMIGNADWDLKTSRNLKYLNKDGKVIPVPYDFDFSGLVKAPYAIPNPDHGINNVQTRVFLGFPEDVQDLRATLAYFKTKRDALIQTINNFKGLDQVSKANLIDYINSFYVSMNEIAMHTPKKQSGS